jgi:threonyl-tRNA synthetase
MSSQLLSASLVLRQSAAELLAMVLIDLFPGAILAESTTTEFGFFCDVIASQPIDDYALPLIEEKMRGFAKQDIEVRALDMMREVAVNFLEHKKQPLRADALRNANENIVSLIQIADFCDYCPLPFISGTKEVEHFKILKIEEVERFIPEEGYVAVKRVSGTVSSDKQSLKGLIKAIQAGKKVDHTKLPQEMKLFSQNSKVSDLAWIWEAKGVRIKRALTDWWEKEHLEQKFRLVSTPPFMKKSLSDKAALFRDVSYAPIFELDGESYLIPPTVAPSHVLLFQEKNHKFRELPIRIAELSPSILPLEKQKLWGVFNSRIVNADFAHIFCAPEHLTEEIISSLQFIDKIIKMFGFEYHWSIKGRGQKFAGTTHRWDKATASIESAFQQCGFDYQNHSDETAYAGPIAIAKLVDSSGREWDGPSVGLDFNLPAKFSLQFQAADGKNHVPLMIFRSVFGSLERFIALMLENKSGSLPVWLTSEQGKSI